MPHTKNNAALYTGISALSICLSGVLIMSVTIVNYVIQKNNIEKSGASVDIQISPMIWIFAASLVIIGITGIICIRNNKKHTVAEDASVADYYAHAEETDIIEKVPDTEEEAPYRPSHGKLRINMASEKASDMPKDSHLKSSMHSPEAEPSSAPALKGSMSRTDADSERYDENGFKEAGDL